MKGGGREKGQRREGVNGEGKDKKTNPVPTPGLADGDPRVTDVADVESANKSVVCTCRLIDTAVIACDHP